MCRSATCSLARIALAALLAVVLGPAAGSAAEDEPDAVQPEIERLISQLGDERYDAREAAQSELIKLGFDAYEALEAATEHEDLEIASRAKYILRLIRVQWTKKSDPPEVKALLEDYEFQSATERLDRIRRLGRLAGGQGIGPLCRLVRFEGLELLSKYAAMEVLDRRPVDPQGQARWAHTLQENLPRASRPAARWLLCYRKLQEDPEANLADWARLVEAERASGSRTPTATTAPLVAPLLYYLAEAQARVGQNEQAEKTAASARALGPGKNLAVLMEHWEIAVSLQRRGLIAWAEAEYRQIIDSEVPELQVRGRIVLSEMKHDQGDDLGAAEEIEQLLRINPLQLKLVLEQLERTPAQVRARMEYFHACHWQQQQDRQKQREYLDKAIASDPGEIDTLIACYRLPDADPEYHERARGLIKQAAAAMRQRIDALPDEPSEYNQLAWLLGNTEDEAGEALQLAQKAVELSPDNAAFQDTLAHVYFHRGDFQNAVKHQARAAELEPHSGLIAKQLKLFRSKLDQSEP